MVEASMAMVEAEDRAVMVTLAAEVVKTQAMEETADTSAVALEKGASPLWSRS